MAQGIPSADRPRDPRHGKVAGTLSGDEQRKVVSGRWLAAAVAARGGQGACSSAQRSAIAAG